MAGTSRWVIGTVVVFAVLTVAATARYLAGPALREREQRQVMQLVARLNPPAYDNQPYKDVLQIDAPSWFVLPQQIEVYRLWQGDQPAGAVLPSVRVPGYSGIIRVAVSIDASGRIRGVRVLEHRETPGIGDAVTRTDWLADLRGRSWDSTNVGRWRVRPHGGDFDQLSGATTSAHAVLTLVRDCLRLYTEQGEAWFASPAGAARR